MKALFIGGTGIISTAVVERLVKELKWEVWLINRGNRKNMIPEGVHSIIADINNEADVAEKIRDLTFDTVCEFIGFRQRGCGTGLQAVSGKDRTVYLYQFGLCLP